MVNKMLDITENNKNINVINGNKMAICRTCKCSCKCSSISGAASRYLTLSGSRAAYAFV